VVDSRPRAKGHNSAPGPQRKPLAQRKGAAERLRRGRPSSFKKNSWQADYDAWRKRDLSAALCGRSLPPM
jgi:hypothetical protein